MKPCVFFDRDGVINQSPGDAHYVLSVDDFHLVPKIEEVVQEVKRAGWLAVLVTSQKCVGKGLIDRARLDQIHQTMESKLMTSFDAIYAYTGEDDSPFPAKPDPGMVFLAQRELDIDLSRSWLIGDADRDIEMGQLASVSKTVRFVSEKPINIEADFQVETADDLLNLLRTTALHPDSE